MIQSIYAVGLALEDIAGQAEYDLNQVHGRIDEVVDSLNSVVVDIRAYIMDLGPRELQSG